MDCFRDFLDSLEGLDTRTTGDEEGNGEERSSVLSEAIDHSDVIAYLRRTSSNLRETQRTANRSVWRYVKMCDRVNSCLTEVCYTHSTCNLQN